MATLTRELAQSLLEDQEFNPPSSYTALYYYDFVVVIPDGYTSIGSYAFANQKITGVHIPESVKSIEYAAFSNTFLDSINIPDSVETIGLSAFSSALNTRNGSKDVYIPDSVKQITEGAFTHINGALKSLSIPGDVSLDVTGPSRLSAGSEECAIVSCTQTTVIRREVASPSENQLEESEEDTLKHFRDAPFVMSHLGYTGKTQWYSYDELIKDTIFCGFVIGTTGKDKIIGTSSADILAGGLKKDKLRGGKGSDGFMFDYTAAFGKKHADVILDFNSSDGDRILIDHEDFDGVAPGEVDLAVFASKKEFKKLSKTIAPILYDSRKGRLYLNENHEDKSLGDGGVFAQLKGAPDISADNFIVLAF